jgi:2-polyprenyl-3-methyl-5-hydroxy-6-metoxy-1,4-benzoquinol methylase
LAVELWNACVPPDATAAEVELLMAELGLSPGAAVLDMPCGAGRHAVPLAQRGCRVTGVDLSEEFLAHAARAADAASVDIRWIRADMTEPRGTRAFDAAICMGNSFGYLGHTDTLQFLGAVSAALIPGARFAIDTGTLAESLLPNLEEQLWLEAGGITMLIQHDYDAAASRLDTVYTFLRDGARETRRSAHHVYTLAELGRMLADAGLRLRDTYADSERTPYALGSPRAFVIAEKPR